MKTEDRKMIINLKDVPEDLPPDKIPNGAKFDIMVVKSPKFGTAILDHSACEECDKSCPENTNIVVDQPHHSTIARLTEGLDSNVADGAEFIYNMLEPDDAEEFVMCHDMNRAVANKIGAALSEGDNVYAVNNLLSYVTQMIYHANQNTKRLLYHIVGDCK